MGHLPRSLIVHCPSVRVATIEIGQTPVLPSGNTVHLWYATLDSLRPRIAELEALLDPVEQERAERFRFDVDRERFILGHGLLRSLLGKYLKRDASLVRMARGPFGKPYLERKDLRFNMSDTKDAVLIAFANKLEIGADIETMARDVDHQAVSEHYFTAPEILAMRPPPKPSSQGGGLSEDFSKRRFLEFWTRKEAVLKASGVGIMDDLRALRVNDLRNTMMIEHEAFITMAAEEYHVQTLQVGAQHLVSVACPVEIEGVVVWKAEEF
ncbi:MAG: 4'-phosphopantetheinyl transferase superfamily protein [Flavobacteriales bacterium]|nr:4'-phosphopantetheinyl transferase superfamily protein [Flavobacteriales bacterium]MBL0044993.1 4'-phosphopantetheinyl transferase superfamily protein [Flavobacteriales bacterium]